MECQVVNNSLSDYLDGGLPESEAQTVEIHINACQPCGRTLNELSDVRQAARELPLHTPTPELWNRIRANLAQELDDPLWQAPPERAKNWWQRLLDRRISFNIPQLAGASAMALALLISGVYFVRERSTAVLPSSPERAIASMLPEERELKQQIENQVREINLRKDSWDPEVRAGFESHLVRIDQSIENCRRTLAHNAQDRDHQQMYISLYQEKLRLLEDINRLKW
jgi:hypothetical protein